MTISGLPIEAKLTYAFNLVEAEATEDLRDKIAQVEANIAKKDRLRAILKRLEEYKTKYLNGDDSANGIKAEMIDMLDEAGYTADNSTLASLVTELPTDPSGKSKEDRDKDLQGAISSFEKVLETDMQSLGDISQQLQFAMNEANNTRNRAISSKSNYSKAHNQTLNNIIRNIGA